MTVAPPMAHGVLEHAGVSTHGVKESRTAIAGSVRYAAAIAAAGFGGQSQVQPGWIATQKGDGVKERGVALHPEFCGSPRVGVVDVQLVLADPEVGQNHVHLSARRGSPWCPGGTGRRNQ